MKKVMRILCLLVCVVMCMGAFACANNTSGEPEANPQGDTLANDVLEQENVTVEPEADKNSKEVAYSTYELTLADGTVGAILVNDFNAAGRLLKTSIKGDVDDFGGLVTMYMDHNYSEDGVLVSSTVYCSELYDVFGPAWIYEKDTTINWTADESGRTVSGMVQSASYFWSEFKITYHGDTRIPDTVIMSELGDPKDFCMVKYDENGKKISDQYGDDIVCTYTYESDTVTRFDMYSPRNEISYGGDYVIEYDGQGRIIKTLVAEEEDDEYAFFFTYVGDGNTVATCRLEHQEDDGEAQELEFTFEYGEDTLLDSCVSTFKELLNGEVEELAQEIHTIQRDDLGRVVQRTEQSIYDEIEQSKEIITVEYNDSLSLTSRGIQYSLNRESNVLEEYGSSVDYYKYDENGQRIEAVYERFDKNNDTSYRSEYRFEYDALGNCKRREEVNYQGDKKTSTSIFDYVFGDLPLVLKVTYCRYGAQDERTSKTSIEYEYNGDFSRTKETETNYDQTDAITSRHIYEYDEKGQKISYTNVIYQGGEVSSSSVTLYEYYADGKSSKTQETRYKEKGEIRERTVREYEYDQYGVDKKLTVSYYDESLTLTNVNVTEKVMLDRNRMQSMTDSKYDGEGNLLEKRVIENVYDGEDLVKRIEIFYDGEGNEFKRTETEY